MTLLHVIPSVDPASGGPIEWIRQFSSSAAAQGHTVDIVSLDGPGSVKTVDLANQVYVCGPSKLGVYSYAPRFVSWMQENSERYDVVIVNGIWAYHSVGTWRALRKSSVPYVVFPHGMLDPWFKRTFPLKHLKKCLYWPWSDYRLLRDAKAVLFTCEEEKTLARQSFALYRCREIVTSIGTTAFRGDESAQRASFHRSFPETRGKRLALFLGRLHPKKGCDVLIRAFAKALAAQRGWHLVMAGPDVTGWKSELIDLSRQLSIADQITWTGMIRGGDKWGALLASDIFVLPSHQENFGLVVAEALACGVPVLTSDKVNIWREIVEDGAGLAGQDDVDGTCTLLTNWIEMSETNQQLMRQRARACFDNRFEIGQVSAALLGVLKEVVQ